MRTRRALPVALLSASLLALAACGGGSTSAEAPTGGVTASPALAAEVPAALKSKGTMTVAADASYAPNEFVGPDGTTIIGMDAELAQAIGATLGLKTTVVNSGFDAIIPGLSSGKFDLGMSSFTDTKEREKTVDFVTYFNAGTAFYAKAGSTAVKTIDDLCGKKVSVEKGTTQADDAAAQSKKCTAAGKPAVDVQVFADQNAANLAISSGRADVGMADSPVAAYQVKQSGGAFALSGDVYGTAPYGVAIPKNSGMVKPVQDALKALIADGTYRRILDKYGVASGALTDPAVNAAKS